MTEMYNRLVIEGIFPDLWKTARVVLVKNLGKEGSDASSYRPISLLDIAGKLMERLVRKRLDEWILCKGGLDEAQFGFRKGKSTMDMVKRVLAMARHSRSAAYQHRQVCACICLDVENAFNSLSWGSVVSAISRWEVPGYLINVIKSYLTC